jgi:hypothetical protein
MRAIDVRARACGDRGGNPDDLNLAAQVASVVALGKSVPNPELLSPKPIARLGQRWTPANLPPVFYVPNNLQPI